jgi:hypothetical protein
MAATMPVVGLHSRLAFSEGTLCLPLKHTSLDVAPRAPPQFEKAKAYSTPPLRCIPVLRGPSPRTAGGPDDADV